MQLWRICKAHLLCHLKVSERRLMCRLNLVCISLHALEMRDESLCVFSVGRVCTHCALCAPPGSMKPLHQTAGPTWRTASSQSPPQLWGSPPGSRSQTPSPPTPGSSFSASWQGWKPTGKPPTPSPPAGRRKVGRRPPRCGWACSGWSSPGSAGWTGGAGGAGRPGSLGRGRCQTWGPAADTWRWRCKKPRGRGGGVLSQLRWGRRRAWEPGRGRRRLGRPRQWRRGPSGRGRPVELAGRRGCPSWRGGGGPFTSVLVVLRRGRGRTQSEETEITECFKWSSVVGFLSFLCGTQTVIIFSLYCYWILITNLGCLVKKRSLIKAGEKKNCLQGHFFFFNDSNTKFFMSSFCETHPVATPEEFLQLQFWTNFNREWVGGGLLCL